MIQLYMKTKSYQKYKKMENKFINLAQKIDL